MTVLAFEPVAVRHFQHWSMAYVGQCSPSSNAFRHIAQTSGFSIDRLSGERVFNLLREHLSEAGASPGA